jgi:hypothetical protein
MEAQVKLLTLLNLLLVVLFASQNAGAACGKRGNADASAPLTRCMNLEDLVSAAVTKEEAEKLGNELMKLGEEAIARACTPGEDLAVNEVTGKLCEKGGMPGKLCSYHGKFNCQLNGKNFAIEAEGACRGGAHDCGTFADCVRDTTLESSAAYLRGPNDPIPKGAGKSSGAGVRR